MAKEANAFVTPLRGDVSVVPETELGVVDGDVFSFAADATCCGLRCWVPPTRWDDSGARGFLYDDGGNVTLARLASVLWFECEPLPFEDMLVVQYEQLSGLDRDLANLIKCLSLV